MEFLDIFPNGDVSLDSSHGFRAPFPDPRNQHLRVRNELTDGYAVTMSRGLRVESDGVAFDFEDPSWQYYLVLPSTGAFRRRNEAEFDALLAVGGDLSSLKAFGMDFSLPPMDVAK